MINVIRSFFQTYRISVCFCLLFCTVISAAFLSLGGAIPVHMDKTVEALASRAPLSSPDVIISPFTLQPSRFSDDARSALEEYGDLTLITTLITTDRSGLPILAVGMPQSALSKSISLREGRLPQNENECVIVSVGTLSQSFAVIGSSVSFEENETPLTVVGIGENLHGILDIYDRDVTVCVSYTGLADTITDPAAMIYTTDRASYTQNNAVCELALLDLNSTVEMLSAQKLTESLTERVNMKQDQNNLDAYNDLIETVRLRSDELRTLQKQITTQEIRVQELENQLDVATLKIVETENLLFDEMNALQTEKQEFIAQMEINEYYCINQVTLIPRRERAEEGYALHQKEIDTLTEVLHSAYRERNSVKAALQTEQLALAEMGETCTEMEQQLLLLSNAYIAFVDPHIRVTLRGQTEGERTLNSLVLSERRSQWTTAAVLFTASAVLTVLFFSAIPYRKKWIREFLFSVAVFSMIGVVFGTCILPYATYRRVFPPLAEQIPLSVFHGSLIPTLLLYWVISAAIISACCLIGSMIAGKTASKASV